MAWTSRSRANSSSPYTLLAHYTELQWAARFGATIDLIRVSIGLEDTLELIMEFTRALVAIDTPNT